MWYFVRGNIAKQTKNEPILQNNLFYIIDWNWLKNQMVSKITKPNWFLFKNAQKLKGGNLDCTSRVICVCWYQISRFFNFGGHFYYSNFSSWSNESALRFFDFALFHGQNQVLSLFARFHVRGVMKIGENCNVWFFHGFMYPGSWKLEKSDKKWQNLILTMK